MMFNFLKLPLAATLTAFLCTIPLLAQQQQDDAKPATEKLATEDQPEQPPNGQQQNPETQPEEAATDQTSDEVTDEQAPVSPILSTEELIDSMGIADLQETVTQIKENYIHTSALDDVELSRSMVQGLLERIGTGALLVQDSPQDNQSDAYPFYAEILDDRIGYVRLGTLGEETVPQLDAALENFVSRELGSLILDLRVSPDSGSFDIAFELLKRFVPKGELVFSIKRPGAKQERIFTSDREPLFNGLIMVIADNDTAGAAEVIAGAIRAHAKSLVIGEATAGQGVEYSDRKLTGGQILRIAVAEVTIPEHKPIFPHGVVPDITVAGDTETKQQLMQASLNEGMSKFVFDKERPRMNEAALVAGTTPEFDSFRERQQNGGEIKKPLQDEVLQRAVDLITTISIYERKPGAAE